MASTHIAFLSTRSEARGVIDEKTLTSLPMVGSVTEVVSQWYFARVTAKMEFANASPAVAKTFIALDTPHRVGGFLASVRVEAETHFLQSKVTELTPDPRAALSAKTNKVFTVDVPWSLHGGQSVLVTAVFYIPLSIVKAHGVSLVLPKELTPKKVVTKTDDDSDTATPGATWASRFAISSTHRVPATVLVHGRGTLFAAVDGSAKSTMPGAAVSKMGDPRRFEVRYENRDVIDQLPQDFEIVANMIPDEDQLVVQAVREDAPFVADNHRVALAIACTPQFGAATASKDKAASAAAAAIANANPNIELTILVDCSGSMTSRAGDVSRAVREIVTSLPSSVFVNIAKFGDAVKWALPESVQLTTQELADQLLAFPLEADMGTTRLYNAIGEAYLKPVVEGHARVILVISDGSETRHAVKLIELAAANVHSTRVAVVSLGDNAHTALFDKLAEVSEGAHVRSRDSANLAVDITNVINPMLVPTLCGTTVEFSYDGVEEKPPVHLTVDHPRMIYAGTRRLLYAFGHKTMRGCTVKVAGLIGSEYKEIKAFSGAADKFDVNSSNDNDVTTVSLVHAAAAASRIDTLVNLNAKAALSAEEKAEVTALSVAFSVPTPYARLVCRADDAPAASFDPQGRVVWAPFVERRETYEVAPPNVARGRDGSAVDPDAVEAAPIATVSASGGAAAFLRGVVNEAVDRVTAKSSVHSLVASQRRAGYWEAANSFLALDFIGVPMSKLKATVPTELATVKVAPVAAAPASPPPPATLAGDHHATATPTAPAAANGTPSAHPPTPGAPAPPAAQSPTPAATTAHAAPAAAHATPAANATPAAHASPSAPPPAAHSPTPAAPSPLPQAAQAPTPTVPEHHTVEAPPTYLGASAEDVWATALVVAWLDKHAEWKNHSRTKWTGLRANAFLAAVGASATKALEKARTVVATL